jgi:hypothetical protein
MRMLPKSMLAKGVLGKTSPQQLRTPTKCVLIPIVTIA